jgi:hypothetical protein
MLEEPTGEHDDAWMTGPSQSLVSTRCTIVCPSCTWSDLGHTLDGGQQGSPSSRLPESRMQPTDRWARDHHGVEHQAALQ